MFLLGLLLPICFVPGYTGATIPTQWALLSCVLPFSMWHGEPAFYLHRWGALFVAYAFASALWAGSVYTSVLGLWYALIWALSFWYGTQSVSLTPLWKGLAIGLSISTLVAMAQALDYEPVNVGDFQLAGLLFNSSLAGVCIAITLGACICEGLWWYTPLLWLGLLLSQSRGAVLILSIMLITKYVHWLAALAMLAAGSLYFAFGHDVADNMRLQVWGYAIRGLTVFGWGPDSFSDVYFFWHHGASAPRLYHAEFAHNDILQLWFEFGIAALVPYTALVLGIARSRHSLWPVLLGCGTLVLFYFPLYTPLTAFILCVLTGHILRDYDWLRRERDECRSAVLSGAFVPRPVYDIASREDIPMEPRHPH
jgi:hypothetical protein